MRSQAVHVIGDWHVEGLDSNGDSGLDYTEYSWSVRPGGVMSRVQERQLVHQVV